MIQYGNAGYLLRKMAAESEEDHTVRNAALAALGIGGLGAGGYGVKKLIDAQQAAKKTSKLKRGLGKGLGGLAALGLLGGGGYALSQNPELMGAISQRVSPLLGALNRGDPDVAPSGYDFLNRPYWEV